jgi:Transposase DDE domain/Transposase domain (DUF772)
MMGKRKVQRELFDVGNVYPLELDPRSFHGQLALAAPRLFRDEEFAVFYDARIGRPSVPPSQLALLTLLQQEAGVSDAEAVDRSAYDLRWAAVLGRSAGTPLCAKSTFQEFRAHLVLHDEVQLIFVTSIKEARRAGLLKGGALRAAVDTKPILGRGAVQDTYNLLATGIQLLARALAETAGEKPAAWLLAQGLARYTAQSVKGSVAIDWSDSGQRQQVLGEIVADARRLLGIAGQTLETLTEEGAERVRSATELLTRLLLQDVEEKPDPSGSKTPQIKEGTTPGRSPSATDPEARHGRKSASKKFVGHKAEIVVEVESQIILATTVLGGDEGDATDVLEVVKQGERNTGQPIEETTADCAYGGGETRRAFAQEGRTLTARVPAEGNNRGLYPKSRFLLDVLNQTVTCPAGQTTGEYREAKDGGRVFTFGAACAGCRLRGECTTAATGRTVRMHPQEELLQAARAQQATEEGRRALRERVVVEHRLARMGQLGAGQARYMGRRKSAFQIALLATIANLRWTWNWAAARACEAVAGPMGLAQAA